MRGERGLWYKLASHLHMSLQECQEKTTSTQFLEWMVFLQEEEWTGNPTRQEHYLAQIACLIHNFQVGIGGGKAVPLEEFLMRFGKTTKEDSVPQEHNREEVVSSRGRGKIEIGPDAIKDPKWAKVNKTAKSYWAHNLGIKELE